MKMLYRGAGILMILFIIVSCNRVVNTTAHNSFTTNGDLKENFQHVIIAKPEKIQFFIENSGSMKGFFNTNSFTRSVHKILSEFGEGINIVKVFTDKGIENFDMSNFRQKMNDNNLPGNSRTDIPRMLSLLLKEIDAKSGPDVVALISDLKYSPVGPKDDLLNQYETDINKLFGSKAYSVLLVGLRSDFKNDLKDGKSQFYLLFVGKQEYLMLIRNQIEYAMQEELLGISEYGFQYGTPQFSVLPVKDRSATIMSDLSSNKSYCLTEYDKNEDQAQFCVALNTGHLPSKLITDENFLIKSVYNSKVDGELVQLGNLDAIDDSIIHRIGANKCLKINISNMINDSDVIEIDLKDSLDQERWIQPFFGATIESDITKTISIENLIAGLRKAFPSKSFCESSMKILISTNEAPSSEI